MSLIHIPILQCNDCGCYSIDAAALIGALPVPPKDENNMLEDDELPPHVAEKPFMEAYYRLGWRRELTTMVKAPEYVADYCPSCSASRCIDESRDPWLAEAIDDARNIKLTDAQVQAGLDRITKQTT